jgi:hypothetical protein
MELSVRGVEFIVYQAKQKGSGESKIQLPITQGATQKS